MVQIAQMGTDALDTMFTQLENTYANQWDSIYNEPTPRLSATFDIGSSVFDTPEDYIKYLDGKIKNFDSRKKGCTPLFNSLSFILPNDLSSGCQLALNKLISTLNDRRKNYPEEVGEVSFYGFSINSYQSENFINILQKLADDTVNPLQILVRIPEWDREAYPKCNPGMLKAKYRSLQNKILDNQRSVNRVILP